MHEFQPREIALLFEYFLHVALRDWCDSPELINLYEPRDPALAGVLKGVSPAWFG